MTNRPKAIGTAAESAVVAYLRTAGFPHAERRALAGSLDLGDLTGCPGIAWEVKGGKAAESASDGQVAAWLDETETERRNSRADVGILVLKRKAIGAGNAGRWWAVMRMYELTDLAHVNSSSYYHRTAGWSDPVRIELSTACRLLRAAGYGTPLEDAAA